MRRRRFIGPSITWMVLSMATGLSADIPKIVNYQGRVADAAGNPVADGSYTMRYRIYDAESGGSLLWNSGIRSVNVSGGVFSVLLGENPQPVLDLDFEDDYWLQVTFEGIEQISRQRLTSVGYAYMASGLVAGTSIRGSESNAVLDVENTETSGIADGIFGSTHSTDGWAICGRALATSGNTKGIIGRAYSPAGIAVYGYNSSTHGASYGVFGLTSSSSGRGVYGRASASNGTADGV